jgi:methylmalonyl-CoA/ethylmalonyl-CoA epimerase
MKVKRIEHVAIAVKSMTQSRKIFEEKLGFKLEYEEYLPQYSTRLAMYPIGSTYIELLESDRHDTETARWIAERGEGLFHICLEVEGIEEALDELREKASSCSTSGRGSGMRIRASLSSTRNQREMS